MPRNRPAYSLAFIGAVVLGVTSAALSLSVFAALLGHRGLLVAPGAFLSGIYGAAAFLVPVYLLGAAFVLADPLYRPARLFALSCSIVPFLTVAFGAAILAEPAKYFELFSIPEYLSPTALAAAVAALTALEGFAIAAAAVLIFGERKMPSPRPTAAERIRPRFLPVPIADKRPPAASEPPALPEPVYAEPELQEVLPALPALRELGSLALERELAAKAADSEDDLPELESVDPALFFEDAPATPDSSSPLVSVAPSPESDAETDDSNDDAMEPASDDEFDESDLDRAFSAAEAEAEAKSRAAAEQAAVLAKSPDTVPPPRKRRDAPYGIPVDGVLTAYPDGQYWVIDQATRDSAVILKNTLEEFKIQAEVTGIRKGPVITMFEILPAPGVKLSKIVNLQDNIALRLAASSVRIVAPIPGKHAVGIEVPNRKRNIVSFREMIEGELHKEGKKAEIPVILGKDITGEAQTLDLVQTPHLLIAGSTGSGKSVCVNSMILSILYQKAPSEVRLILIDPKIVELKLYNDIPHLLTPVITEPKRAFQALQFCIYEMERRYALLDSMGVRDIRSYNKRIKERNIATERIPYIVVVIDEFADLMATTGKELESTVARLAAMSRAVGIHLVLATQRPSIDVITGLIKANIPSRIAFMVASKMDSRIIIDMVGAEKLLGKGDMLFASAWDPFPIRMQGAFVSEEEVERVVEYVKTLGEPDYIDEEIFYDDEEENAEPSLFSEGDDPLYEKALEIVMQQGKASASYIQRRLKIGYNRAARLVEFMEDRGIVGPAQGSKPRDLLRMP